MKPRIIEITKEEYFNSLPGSVREYKEMWKNHKSRIRICSEDRNYPVLKPDPAKPKPIPKSAGNDSLRRTNKTLNHKFQEGMNF